MQKYKKTFFDFNYFERNKKKNFFTNLKKSFLAENEIHLF
jgi:hypothetical protein